MRIVRTVAEVREVLRAPRLRGRRIGLVPTMGAFHAGHLALIRAARAASDVVVVSLFVNPTQFDDTGDLERYPRTEESDARAASDEGVDLLFAPSGTEIYPAGFATTVDPGELGTVLEGAARPGHFRGVATVCVKLFGIVLPDAAWFGQKDAQQIAIIRQVVRDLDLPLEIIAVPTVRDADGLALSSRNARLTDDERRVALALPQALTEGFEAHRRGVDAVAEARRVLDATGRLAVDYVAIADLDGPTLVAAIRIGSTRLIDNVRLEADSR
jgi:pantoate--beta-alanine ligase